MDLATVDKGLTTTRSVDIATQAPVGGNNCRYHFVVVTDPKKRSGLADLYRKAMEQRLGQSHARQPEQHPTVWESALYLVEHLHEVPVHILTCVDYASPWPGENQRAAAMTHILPVTWSLMLALRSRGIGSAFTTIHTHYYEREAAALLGIRRTSSRPRRLLRTTGRRLHTGQARPGQGTDVLGQLGQDSLGPGCR